MVPTSPPPARARSAVVDFVATGVTYLAVRWGGEEFVILFPDTQLDEARLIMERLRASVALDSEFGSEGWPVTFSCGLAALRTFGELGEATRRAEAALHFAKDSGRNRVQVATTD